MSAPLPTERRQPGIAQWDMKEALLGMHTIENRRRANVAQGLFIVLCLACDFLQAPVLASIQSGLGFVAHLGVLGCVLAQGNLLAAWLAWSEGPFLIRLTRHWAIAAVLYLVWVAGFSLAGVNQFAVFGLSVGLFVPLVSLAAQTPLWIAWQSFGWRLIRRERVPAGSRSPLTIRRLMTATLVAAATFGLARLAPPIDNGPQWPFWAFTFVVAGGFSMLAILPASAMLMRTHELRRGLVFASLYAASYVLILWAAGFTARHFGQPVPPLAIFVGISSFIFSFAATVMSAAAIARLRGYRLVWGQSNVRNVVDGTSECTRSTGNGS